MVTETTTITTSFTTTTTTQNPITTVATSPTLVTTTMITATQMILNNYYIQFSLSLNVSNENITDTQFISELTFIFTIALSITSNQLNISIITETTSDIVAQVRFFSTATESADSLLIQTQEQIANPFSKIRQQSLTSQLNPNSIENIQRYYTCSNVIIQQSPCTTNGISKSGSSLSVI
jgi:hypothetical protein